MGLDDFLDPEDRPQPLGNGDHAPADVAGHRIVAFDLETTGLDPENDRIVEFCFIELDDGLDELSRWSERVNPGVPIPPETTAVHGITDADVAACPTFDAFADRIQAILDDSILMAYNHGFDINTVHYELVRHGRQGLRMDHPVIDPLVIFRQHHPHSLAGAVKQYLDESFDDAHAAEADTEKMVDVFRAQIKAHGLPAKASDNLLQRDRRFLDRSRKFYEDTEGVVRFGFGKYRHEPINEHIDYVQWMINRDFPEDTKNVAKRLIDASLETSPGAGQGGQVAET